MKSAEDHQVSDAAALHPLLAEYTDRLSDQLKGQVSPEDRMVLVDETAFILQRSYNERLVLGDSTEMAVKHALKEMGPSALVASQHAQGLFDMEGSADSPILRWLGRSMGIALGAFGCADLLYLGVILFRIYQPSEGVATIPVSPATVRIFLPIPMPFPEPTPSYFFTVVYPILVPIVLGWIVGKAIPVRAHVAVYRTLMPIIIVSFLLGCLLLPNTEGLVFAVIQTVFWLPVGCLTSYVACKQASRKRSAAATRKTVSCAR